MEAVKTLDEATKNNRYFDIKKILVFATLKFSFVPSVTASGTETGSPSLSLLGIIVFLPFIAAVSTPLVYRFLEEKTSYFAAGTAAICFISVLILQGNGKIGFEWIPALNISISFYIDGLSILMGLLASGIGFLIFIYSSGYMKDKGHQIKFYSALLAFMGSMLGLAFSENLITLFVFWELTSLCSFFLIGYYQDKTSMLAARKSMIITVGGGLLMLIAFLLIESATGTFSLVELLSRPEHYQIMLRESGLYLPILVLLGIGAAAKSAQIPFQIWLPDAMAAPTPVSAFLHSATMVKAGVYLLGRFRPLMIGQEWMMLFVPLGLLTMTTGGLLAVASTDIKELLAYSTISHLGMIVAGFGFISDIGSKAAGFHILNHAFFKASLFLVAGIIAHEAGTRKISKLKGLGKDLPYTAFIAVIGGLAMAGVPPFNGFQSKELLFKAAYQTASITGGLTWIIPGIAVLGSVFTFAYSMKFISIFFGERDAALEIHRPGISMIVPGLWLALGVIFITLLPQTVVNLLVNDVISSSLLESSHLHLYLIPHLSPALGMSFVTILSGIAVFRYYETLHTSINEFLKKYPSLTSNWWYEHSLQLLEILGRKISDFAHHGLLRGYAAIFLSGVSLIALSGFLATAVSLPAFTGISVSLPVIIVLTVGIFAALALLYVDSHIAGVLILSIIGAIIAIYYILIGAPDLALTQLVVETLALIIFILILNKVPSFYGGITESKKIIDGSISVFVGLIVTATVLITTSAEPDKISSFFVDKAVSEGGGSNIVNLILVDFRAFDTLGEISVIAMAALSVLALLAMRGRTQLPEARIQTEEENNEADKR